MVQRMTRGKPLTEPRLLVPRKLYHPVTGELLDHGMVVWFQAPKSFTGEDVAELHVHGGRSVMEGVLDALNSGCRPAEPGEFTRRAFDHGKLDLTQVEGIADLIEAETQMQRRLALRQAGGALKHLYDQWRHEMIHVLALVEAVIDFGEEEQIEEGLYERVETLARALHQSLQSHLDDQHKGEILRDGIRMAILGPPNAGKSTLLNLLVKRNAAIVSPIPGTTRDSIQVTLNLAGYPVVLVDTAGLRDTLDPIEQQGVQIALEWKDKSEIKLCVLDATEVMPDWTIPDQVATIVNDPDTLLLFNKTDARSDAEWRNVLPNELRDRTLFISCHTQAGIQTLLTTVTDKVTKRHVHYN
jgi:tRNA modification GTPase